MRPCQTDRTRRRGRRGRWAATILLAGFTASIASAQVVYDDTFGSPGAAATRTLNGRVDSLIEESRGRLVSGGGRVHLFHALTQLDVPTDQSASFVGPSSVDAIITRIHDDAASSIDGLLRSEYAGADLFLINPDGFVFGENASVEVPGSVFVSSADTLRFEDDVVFSAGADAPTITAAAPSAFGFGGGDRAGAIVFDRPLPLRMTPGESLTVAGGDVSILRTGTVLASGGRVQLAAVGAAAIELPLDLDAATLPDQGTAELGRVEIGEQVTIDTLDFGDPDASQGRILIRGGRFVADTSFVFAGGDGSAAPAIDIETNASIEIDSSSVQAFGSGAARTGGVRLASPEVTLSGAGALVGSQVFGAGDADPVEIEADRLEILGSAELASETFGAGAGASIRLEAGTIRIAGGSAVTTETTGTGSGGGITVRAQRVELDEASPLRSSTTAAAGTGNDAGAIDIRTTTLALRGGSQISGLTNGGGRGADVTIVATGAVELEGEFGTFPSAVFARSGDGVGSSATGDAGNVRIEAGSLSIRDGAQVSARTFGAGRAGRVEVSVPEGAVRLEGVGQEPSLISTSGAEGDGNRLSVAARELFVLRGAQIVSGADGVGDSGTIEIRVERLELSGRSADDQSSVIFSGSQLTADAGADLGAAGGIDIIASEGILLDEGAFVSARSRGDGATGDVTLTTNGSIRMAGDARVSSDAASQIASPDAGDAVLTAGGSIHVTDGSQVLARAAGAGDAGDVRLDATRIFVDGALLTTEAAAALGGNIRLIARDSVALQDSRITTDVAGGVGQGGEVEVAAAVVVANASRVTADAGGNADAGNISVRTTGGLLESQDNLFRASAEFGVDGTVVVRGPNSEAVGELAQLPSGVLDAASRLEEACLQREAPSGRLTIRDREVPDRLPGALFGPDELGAPGEGGAMRPAQCELPDE